MRARRRPAASSSRASSNAGSGRLAPGGTSCNCACIRTGMRSSRNGSRRASSGHGGSGHAFAGGLEMALACDFAYAVPEARFALTEVTLGIMPGAGGTQLLPRAVGERRAKEIILTGLPFSAQEALDWGIVNRLCPRAELLAEAVKTAATICGNAPLSIRQAKKAIHHGLQMDLKNGLMFEIE